MFDPAAYGPQLAALLTPVRLPPLGPGRENRAVQSALAALQPDEMVAPGRSLHNVEMARSCLAGLWLYHDFLDHSHRISQDLENATGSFWHGIMHRREPDPGNAKYWFRQVGNHPVFALLQAEASAVARRHPSLKSIQLLAGETGWDPFAWIDLCEEARRDERSNPDAELVSACRAISLAEWHLLFQHSFRAAGA